MFELLLLPAILIFALSFIKSEVVYKPLAFVSFLILIPTTEDFTDFLQFFGLV